jgi:WD40 repeat protein
MEHEGTITALAFFDDTHMLSGSEDGTVRVWDTANWACKKVLRGHKGAVEALSIHPSGKLALSVGRDCTLHVWNLVKVMNPRASLPSPPLDRGSTHSWLDWCAFWVYFEVCALREQDFGLTQSGSLVLCRAARRTYQSCKVHVDKLSG